MTRHLIPILSAVFFLTPPALAAEAAPAEAPECALSEEALKPVMVVDKDISAGHRVEKDVKKRTLTESVILRDGMTITYTVGGCAHYVFTYTFDKVPEDIMDKELIDLAIILLNDVPGFEKSEQNKTLTEILKEAKRNGNVPDDDGFLACGDARCTITQEERKVEITYDFAL